MQQSTLNIRLNEPLKRHGMEVLDKEGLGVSEAVRSLFEYLEREQKLPSEVFGSCSQDPYEKRRNLLRNMVGILPKDISLQEVREARLAAHGL